MSGNDLWTHASVKSLNSDNYETKLQKRRRDWVITCEEEDRAFRKREGTTVVHRDGTVKKKAEDIVRCFRNSEKKKILSVVLEW
ncbi:hypothetical protein SESBI_26739 [Sesbania bispinosa]|nr:hypothetical protein SESBI_26739 [Sesbania bispinosa]